MTIIDFFGDYLAEIIEKKPIACKGLIRLAVKDKFPGKTPEELEYSDLKIVFNSTLKNRLENINTPNLSEVITQMNSYLIDNQSLLTMA